MSIFEILFKYKPIIYEKGQLAFQLLGSRWWFLFFLVAAAIGAYFAYRNVARDKYSLGPVALRALTFTILAFIFLRPVLNVSTVLPQESYLAVVIDNSESMKIKDDGQVSRSEQLLKQLEDTKFFPRLEEKFKVRAYRFDSAAEGIQGLERLTFEGKRTKLESATDLLQQELATVPLSGVVFITDGADNASTQWTESLSKLEARKTPIPFYTVGVGSESITRDAEMVKVSAPRSTLKESTAVVDVSYRSHGFSGRKATVHIRENGTLLKSEQVTLPADGEIAEATIDLPVKNEGMRQFSFSLQAPDDRIPENNSLTALVEIKNDHPQILYIEGEPRWEFKFLRRAMQEDTNVRLVTLLRSSQNKFYRQGIDKEEMLSDGFPKTKDELFAYKGLIFGSIESTFFTQEQLKNVVDFVSDRGGGFLMLGGRNSFSGGRYENSLLADILPVQMSSADRTPVVGSLQLLVTDYGRTHPLMKLEAGADANVKQWSDLPPLNDYNKTLEAKVGAIVLARGQAERGADPILLAYQRYGRGRTMALTTGSTWRWQMQMDHQDQTYELFWKQTLRWLVSTSPDPVMITSDKDTYLPGEIVHLSADISNKRFERMDNAKVVAKVRNPDGLTETIPLDWNGSGEGSYQAELNATAPGIYNVEIEATQGSENLGTSRTAFQVEDRPVEFSGASLDTRLLQSIANSTGGRYYPLSRLGDIPDDAQYVDTETSFVEQKELWDVPFLFMLLCMTFGGEWFWRKKKGLA